MNKLPHPHSLPHKYMLLLVILTGVIALVWLVWRLSPASANGMRHSTCLLTCRQDICLVQGHDTVTVSSERLEGQGTWMNRQWWLPSCLGRIVTTAPHVRLFNQSPWPQNETALHQLLQAHVDSLETLIHSATIERKELVYYLRCHNVIDEGYGSIVKYSYKQKAQLDSLTRLQKALNDMNGRKNIHLVCRRNWQARWVNRYGTVDSALCKSTVTTHTPREGLINLHIPSHLTPVGVSPVSRYPWIRWRSRDVLAVVLVPTQRADSAGCIIVEGKAVGQKHDIPALLLRQGAPVFTRRGCYIGSIDGNWIKK